MDKHALIGKLKWLFSFIYFKQIKLVIPTHTIRQLSDSLPEDYILRSPDDTSDLKGWADLLNSDGNFGHWTPETVKSEIIDNLILPGAASLLVYKGSIVGSVATCEYPSRRLKRGMIMWVIIDQHHRRKGFSYHLFSRTMNYFLSKGYNKSPMIATDSYRSIAIHFYLKVGAQPLYDSLFSFIQWWHVKRKIRRLNHKEFFK